MISLDQSKSFDRVIHCILESCFVWGRFWASILQLDLPSVCVPRIDAGSERGKIEGLHFVSIDFGQGCPFLPVIYVLPLEPFLCKLRVTPVQRDRMLISATMTARYIAYVDDIIGLVTNSTELDEVNKKIGRYKVVTRTKIKSP